MIRGNKRELGLKKFIDYNTLLIDRNVLGI